MKANFIRSSIACAGISALGLLSSCKDKPSSGSNNLDYRDGASGATSKTIMKDTEGGKFEPPAKNTDH